MSKSKIATDVASTLTSIAGSITSPSLSKTERGQLRARNDNAPDELIEMVAHLAQQNAGTVAGIPFDSTTALATLAQTSATRTTIGVGHQTLQRMEDDMIQQRATVADPAFAIYTALRRLVKTKSGNSLTPAYEQMKSIVKNRPRKSRAKGTTTETTSTPSTSSAVAAVPAATEPSTPTQPAAPKAVVTTSS